MSRLSSLVAIALLGAACSSPAAPREPNDAGGSDTDADMVDCDRFTDAGFRICCGRASELPEISCVDLTKENGEFGIFGRCLGEGEPFDAKFAGAICCAGLTRTASSVEADGGVTGDPAGCLAVGTPSIKACRPCGNGRCDLGENRCNCPADCS